MNLRMNAPVSVCRSATESSRDPGGKIQVMGAPAESARFTVGPPSDPDRAAYEPGTLSD